MSSELGEGIVPTPRRRSRVRLIVGVLILALVILGLWEGAFSHDYNLWRLSRSFAQMKHPKGTAQVACKKSVGLLVGNGNHTDYFVGELRSYTCSKKQVVDTYEGQHLRNPMTGKWEPVSVVFTRGAGVAGCPDPTFDLLQAEENVRSGTRCYIVYFLDAGYPSGIDFRSI